MTQLGQSIVYALVAIAIIAAAPLLGSKLTHVAPSIGWLTFWSAYQFTQHRRLCRVKA